MSSTAASRCSVYGTLHSILTSGPFEVLYDGVVEQPQHDNVAI